METDYSGVVHLTEPSQFGASISRTASAQAELESMGYCPTDRKEVRTATSLPSQRRSQLLSPQQSNNLARLSQYLSPISVAAGTQFHSPIYIRRLLFVCAGFDMGTPVVTSSDFYLQANSVPKVTPTERILTPGLVIPMGRAEVATEILRGNSTALQQFKNGPIVKKYREAKAAVKLSSLTERDLLLLSSACLDTTESTVAQNFSSSAADVSGPNRFAVIDQKHGFRWATP